MPNAQTAKPHHVKFKHNLNVKNNNNRYKNKFISFEFLKYKTKSTRLNIPFDMIKLFWAVSAVLISLFSTVLADGSNVVVLTPSNFDSVSVYFHNMSLNILLYSIYICFPFFFSPLSFFFLLD